MYSKKPDHTDQQHSEATKRKSYENIPNDNEQVQFAAHQSKSKRAGKNAIIL